MSDTPGTAPGPATASVLHAPTDEQLDALDPQSTPMTGGAGPLTLASAPTPIESPASAGERVIPSPPSGGEDLEDDAVAPAPDLSAIAPSSLSGEELERELARIGADPFARVRTFSRGLEALVAQVEEAKRDLDSGVAEARAQLERVNAQANADATRLHELLKEQSKRQKALGTGH